MERSKKILILKIVVIAIACFIVFSLVMMIISLSLTSALLLPVENQLELLKKGEIEAAYNLTSEKFKEKVGREDFEEFLKANPLLTSEHKRTFGQRIVQDEAGLVDGVLTDEKGNRLFIEYNLLKEEGIWKIIYFRVSVNPL